MLLESKNYGLGSRIENDWEPRINNSDLGSKQLGSARVRRPISRPLEAHKAAEFT
jgi:hypothetical protein